jgi:hypothetical protein
VVSGTSIGGLDLLDLVLLVVESIEPLINLLHLDLCHGFNFPMSVSQYLHSIIKRTKLTRWIVLYNFRSPPDLVA